MNELVQPEDSVRVEEGWYECHEVKRGDWVLVRTAGRPRPLLKIALVMPGDSFSLKAAKEGERTLEVNGKTLRTPRGRIYIFSRNRAKMLELYASKFGGIMPADSYFVFGTVPSGSLDSSRFGPVSKSELIARARRLGR